MSSTPPTTTRLCITFPVIAQYLNDLLTEAAGEEVAWVLVVQADEEPNYVSNAARPDGRALIETLLQRWDAGRSDIPAHYNPDLPR